MDAFYFMLKALVLLVLLAGLVWSLRLRAKQKQERDIGVSSAVKANPRLLNPVILSYIFFFAFVFVVIWFFKLYYMVPF